MVAIVRVIAVTIFALVTGVAGAQDCASSAAPACAGTCQSDSVCRNDSSTGVPGCGCVITVDLAVSKMSVKLNFKKAASDSIQVQGFVDVPAGFDPTGVRVIVDVGGVVKAFTLNDKGKAKTETEQVKLTVKQKAGVVLAQAAKFAVKFAKGDFSSSLVDEGLVNATVDDVPVSIDVTVDVDATVYKTTVSQIYKAKQGSTGRTK